MCLPSLISFSNSNMPPHSMCHFCQYKNGKPLVLQEPTLILYSTWISFSEVSQQKPRPLELVLVLEVRVFFPKYLGGVTSGCGHHLTLLFHSLHSVYLQTTIDCKELLTDFKSWKTLWVRCNVFEIPKKLINWTLIVSDSSLRVHSSWLHHWECGVVLGRYTCQK